MLKVSVLLLAVAFVAWRLRPSWRLPWAVPLGLVAGLLVLRTVGWLTAES